MKVTTARTHESTNWIKENTLAYYLPTKTVLLITFVYDEEEPSYNGKKPLFDAVLLVQDEGKMNHRKVSVDDLVHYRRFEGSITLENS